MAFQISSHSEVSVQTEAAASSGPMEGPFPPVSGNWCEGHVSEGPLQLTSLSKLGSLEGGGREATSTKPTAEVAAAGPGSLVPTPVQSSQYGWFSRLPLHHFIYFVIFLVSFIFPSFFILTSLPFKISPCLFK